MPFVSGLPISNSGALECFPVSEGSAPLAGTSYVNGKAVTAGLGLCVVDAGAAVPSTAVLKDGIALTQTGFVYCTSVATGGFSEVNGFKVRNDGAMLLSAGTTANATLSGIARAANGGILAGSSGGGVSFAADLQSSLIPLIAAGSATPTFTRATTAYVADQEALLKQMLSGEARFTGARRVKNFVASSESISGWTADDGGSIASSTLTFTASAGARGYLLVDLLGYPATRRTFVFAVKLSTTAGTKNVRIGTVIAGGSGLAATLSANVSVSTTPTWFSVLRDNNGADAGVSNTAQYIQIYNGDDAVAGSVVVEAYQLEEVTGQSNQNPSEYVSVGVLSAPYHGAGVDGVKYFTTLNGNTVSSNVVTDATGAPITSANSSTLTTDASGPFGSFVDPAQTDVLGTTAAIRRTMTDVGWVSGGGGITVGTATGADGAPNAAASLTAAGANGTILFTTVLGAAVRTYGALVRRKAGTGTVNITADNGATWTAMTLTTTYKPFYFTTASVANPIVGFRIVTAADAIEVDFNTLIAGSNKFPYFTPVNVNQAATVEQYVSAGNLPTNNFTIYGESCFPQVQPAGSYYLFGTYVDANNGTAVLWDGTNLIARRRISGVSSDATIALAPTAGTAFKWAARFSSTTGTDIFLSGTKGTNEAVNTACQIGTNFQIGADGNGANQSFATDRNKHIYPAALTDAQLQAMTT